MFGAKYRRLNFLNWVAICKQENNAEIYVKKCTIILI